MEELAAGEPRAVAAENARRKARAVAALKPAAVVLGADTVVALDDAILPKPADADRARMWLERLSGATHEVVGGICLVEGGEERERVCVTGVTFRALQPAIIDWYIATGEWRDRAGGYAIQGHGAALVEGIDGDYQNVVGLSVAGLLNLMPNLIGGARR